MEPNPYETPKAVERKVKPRRATLFFVLLVPLTMLASAIAGVGTCKATVRATLPIFNHSQEYGLIIVTMTVLGGAVGGVAALAFYAISAHFFWPSHRLQVSRMRFVYSLAFIPLHCVLALLVGLAVSWNGLPESSYPIAGVIGFLSLIVTWHLTPKHSN